MKVSDILKTVHNKFENSQLFFGHGSDNAWDESVYLVMSAMGLPLTGNVDDLNKIVPEIVLEKIYSWVKLRVEHKKPLPYITNTAYFCSLPFYVDERVLIPRSPLWELITNSFQPWIKDEPKTILDLCTGSGCIAIACGYAFPQAQIVATDISKEALQVAAINQRHHQQQDSLKLIQSDLFKSLDADTFQFDLIISNPPYVDAEDMSDLPDEFKVEPKLALAAGEDGLDLVHHILYQASNYLTEKGILIVEVGNSAGALQDTYPQVDFTWLEFENGGLGVFLLTREQLIHYFNS